MSKAGSLILFVARHSAWLNRVLSHALPTAEFSSYDRGRWEREYQEGGWDWLRNAREAVH